MSQPVKLNYQNLLNTLKEKIRSARIKAALTINAQLLSVYWEIGKVIIGQQQTEGWGTKIIDRLAADLKVEFPDQSRFSVRNLKYMPAFAKAYPDFTTLQLPDSQNKTKIGKKKSEIVQVALAQSEKDQPNTIVQAARKHLIQWFH